MRRLFPSELIVAIKRELGDTTFYRSGESDYAAYDIDEIMERCNTVIQELWAEYIAGHGHKWINKETVTIVGTTQEYVLAEQGFIHGTVNVYDSDNLKIPIVDYSKLAEYEARIENCVYFRENAAGELLIGILYPANATSLIVSTVSAPPIMCGGQGVTGTGTCTIPVWGPRDDDYYDSDTDVEFITIANGRIATYTTKAVSTNASATIVCTGITASSDTLWCVCPMWAPIVAKDLIAKRTARRLMESTNTPPSNTFDTGLQMAEYRFKRAYTAGREYSLEPHMIDDGM